ncbi:MAG: 1-acyl-sn-glycerol-3-phosphate acyltransferase [Bacteroidales bacterium]|nr:1-acyl-sn-glycerol-3-phosphate acyltransferase [Bacteroidales bacterium]
MNGDRIFIGIIAVLVKILYNPKVYSEDGTRKRKPRIEGPAILVCNHTSHLDGPIVGTTLKGPLIHSLAAKDRFEQKGFGFFLRHTCCIPIDRQHADTSWIHESLKILSEGGCVAIFPEGRHGLHRQQLPFHSGVSMLAVMARVPVTMVYIDGPHRIFRRTGMMVGEPFTIEVPAGGLSADYVDEQTRILEEKMRCLMQKYTEV